MLGQMRFVGDRASQRDSIEAILGLDVPVHIQYVRWIGDILLHGSLGDPLLGTRPVAELILSRLPTTLELSLLATVIAGLAAVPIGVYSASAPGYGWRLPGTQCVDHLCVRAHLLDCNHSHTLPLDPVGLVSVNRADSLCRRPPRKPGHVPASGSHIGHGPVRRHHAHDADDDVGSAAQDYIRTAWSKGVRERRVVIRHALKNALIPVVTLIGIQFPLIVGGSLIIEELFQLPGIGRLMMDAIGRRDYPVVSGINLVVATVVVLMNVLVDLTYAWIDPRIHYR